MGNEQQYIELYEQARQVIFDHAAEPMNAVRDAAFEDFKAQGFPSRKVERYKYTDIPKLFEPDYGVNLNRLEIPVDPYQAFRCDVPNLSTSLYFVVNDAFYRGEMTEVRGERIPLNSPKLPEGVIVGSLREHFSHPSPLKVLRPVGQDQRRCCDSPEYDAGTGWHAGLCSQKRKVGPCHSSN